MKRAILKINILRRIKMSRVNAYALLKELNSNKRFARFGGPEKMKNEVYNTIKSLEKSNYIKSSQKIEKGKLKNYYTVTKSGNQVLASARRIFRKNIKEMASLLS